MVRHWPPVGVSTHVREAALSWCRLPPSFPGAECDPCLGDAPSQSPVTSLSPPGFHRGEGPPILLAVSRVAAMAMCFPPGSALGHHAVVSPGFPAAALQCEVLI
jgi:hypothetical protein